MKSVFVFNKRHMEVCMIILDDEFNEIECYSDLVRPRFPKKMKKNDTCIQDVLNKINSLIAKYNPVIYSQFTYISFFKSILKPYDLENPIQEYIQIGSLYNEKMGVFADKCTMCFSLDLEIPNPRNHHAGYVSHVLTSIIESLEK